MTEEEVLEQAVAMVKYAKQFCSDIEFSAEDASRTRPQFLFKVLEGVIKAGATVVNIPDTVGYSTPKEFGKLIRDIRENVSLIDKVDISVHCHNDLGLAVANSLAAIENGAVQIESTVNGLGERAGNASVEEVIMGLNTRKDYYNISHKIDTTQIYRTSKLVSSLTGVNVQPNKAIVGANAFAHESGIHQHGMLAEKTTYEIMTPQSVGLNENKMVLGKLSGKHAFEDRLKELGYIDLKNEDITSAFEKFKILADKKKVITDRDIEALIEENTAEIPKTYEIENFQFISGRKLLSTSTIELKKGNEIIVEAATGDGPVDAAFKAIERATGIIISLEDYNLKSVTEGKDALGEVAIKVSKNNLKFIGRGLSTDIIEASVIAYVNVINKIINEFGEDNLNG
jgi:2-isopropylmalate synthase